MSPNNVTGAFSVNDDNAPFSGNSNVRDQDAKPLWQSEEFTTKKPQDVTTNKTQTLQQKPTIDTKKLFGDDNDITRRMLSYKTSNDPKFADDYLKSIKPWIDTAIKSYAGGDSNPVLRTMAKNIALDATKNFDPDKGIKLQTYLMSHWQGLQRHLNKVNSPVKVPERTAIDAGRVHKYEVELASQLGRDPTDAELADFTGIPIKNIGRARGSKDFYVESTQQDAGLMVDEPSKSAKDAWIRYVYMDLNDRDRVIMEYSLGLNGKPKLDTNDIAKKLNVTPGSISQRKTHIESVLNEFQDFMTGKG